MQIERAFLGIETLGPGKRFALWVNGCRRKCPGCVSEGLRKFAPQNDIDVIQYLSEFDFGGTDGITISGGEPFEQAEDLAKTTEYFNRIGIEDILVYTGFTIDELRGLKDKNVDYTLQNIAVLIDGPYVRESDLGVGNLKGSGNQNIIFLKPEFKDRYEAFYRDSRSMQEFSICDTVIAIGIPDKKYIIKFMKDTEVKNDRIRKRT
ncbi:MAG: radical SAM protein [Clostridiales bacterium]|jgi:anaerobic ribonucleoside-triphosphate reductase activating protein|nr:radical SAM protein [Clostridiales bacterium]